ncbi:Mycothiol acetyltransferase [Thalassocella blandensis]|nr:Mycothiol acetyltransferase [Thalassocella blandensis]
MTIHIVKVDYNNHQHMQDLAQQLQHYSADPMGGGDAMPLETARKNIAAMSERSFAISFLAYDDDQAVGFCNCFESFSTFAGQAIINIHDLAVMAGQRGKGVGSKLLSAVETHAQSIQAAKLTLEVLEGNDRARRTYQSFGFKPYTLDDTSGCAQFWQKYLN